MDSNWLPDWSGVRLATETLRELELVEDVITLIAGFCKQPAVLLFGGYVARGVHGVAYPDDRHRQCTTLFCPTECSLDKFALLDPHDWSLGQRENHVEGASVAYIGGLVYNFTGNALNAFNPWTRAIDPPIIMGGTCDYRCVNGPVAVDKSLYVFCHFTDFTSDRIPCGSTRAMEYHTTTKTWTRKAAVPGNKGRYRNACAVVVGASIFVLWDRDPSIPGTHNDLEQYYTPADKWYQCEANPNRRYHCAFAADTHENGVLYACGGSDFKSASLGYATSGCERYRIEIGQWEVIANLLTPRCSATAVFVEGSLFVLGGVTNQSHRGVHVSSDCERWKDDERQWVRVPGHMPRGVAGAAAVVI